LVISTKSKLCHRPMSTRVCRYECVGEMQSKQRQRSHPTQLAPISFLLKVPKLRHRAHSRSSRFPDRQRNLLFFANDIVLPSTLRSKTAPVPIALPLLIFSRPRAVRVVLSKNTDLPPRTSPPSKLDLGLRSCWFFGLQFLVWFGRQSCKLNSKEVK